MRTRHFTLLPGLCLCLLALGYAPGCSSTKSVIKKVSSTPKAVADTLLPDRDRLRKRVMLLPVLDRGLYGPERVRRISERFEQLLTKIPDIILSDPPQGFVWADDEKSSRFGPGTDPRIAKDAGSRGINAVIAIVLPPIESRSTKAGIWPFRSPHLELQVSVLMNVVDTATGTLLLTRTAEDSLTIPLEDARMQDEDAAYEQILTQILPGMLEQQAREAGSRLKEDLWTGAVTAVDPGGVEINAGSDVGLRTGQVFEVFRRGEPLQALGGRVLDVLGDKTGELTVTTVLERSARAEPRQGDTPEPGQTIRFKP